LHLLPRKRKRVGTLKRKILWVPKALRVNAEW